MDYLDSKFKLSIKYLQNIVAKFLSLNVDNQIVSLTDSEESKQF